MFDFIKTWLPKKKNQSGNNTKNKNKNKYAKSRRIYCTQTSDYESLRDELHKQEQHFKDNTIRNTKYTAISFLPKALYEQFSLHMNQYFLMLALMQLWRTITPVNPISTWTPLVIVVSVGMIKELVDDLFRLKKDREANEKTVFVLREGRRTRDKSRNVRVGDLVMLKEDETVCADMVVLRTSDDRGACFIETSALDGEEDYKERDAPKLIHQKSMHEIENFNGVIDAPAPNAEIEKFDSTLTMEDGSVISLSQKNLLLQGTVMKSTEWAIGMVVYTGNESKIGMNKQEVKIKWTKMDSFINNAVVVIFLIQFLCGAILGTTGNILREKIERSFYFGTPRDYTPSVFSYVIIPLRFMLLCSLMIPQSLKVTSDICKYVLSLLITYDVKLYDEKSDTPAGAANTSICEDLGQIEYLFTDKTGTLTENVMIYRKCIVNGIIYEAGESELEEQIQNGDSDAKRFMETIVLCNTVFSSINEAGVVHYRSQSPDEEALVNFAKEMGFVLLNRDHESIKIKEFGEEKNYQILQVLEFTSSRRRMSIIIKSNENEEILILSKGGDDAIFSMLEHKSKIDSYKNSVKILADEGLRTMCMAYKTISQAEYEQWRNEYDEANNAMEDRAQRLESAYSTMETNLLYIGCSGIEDSLQEGVADTIQALRDAGIVVWMLTGDKKETATMIGYSCNLIDRYSSYTGGTHIFDIEGESVEQVSIALQKALEEVKTTFNTNRAIIIDGGSLKHIFPDGMTDDDEDKDEDGKKEHNKLRSLSMLSDLAVQCKSVICCRMSPIQKGRIVRMMKGFGPKRRRCLAIGDGGNDVTMILESDVGVGISGKEGLQAVRAADFSIARFKYLKRLLLVHGRNSYRRMAYVSLYTMYKSLILAFCQLLFSGFSAFSGAPLLNTYSLTMYNLIFTAVIPMAFALDKDISDEALENIPELYAETRNSKYMNVKTFSSWFLFAFFQAVVIVFGVLIIMNGQYMIAGTGKTMDYWTEGLVVITVVLIVQQLDCLLLLRNFSIVSLTFTFGSFLAFIVGTLLYSANRMLSGFTSMYMAAIHLASDPVFYFICLLLAVVASAPLFMYQFAYLIPFTPLSLSRFVRRREQAEREKDDDFWMALRSDINRMQKRRLTNQDFESYGEVPEERTKLLQ